MRIAGVKITHFRGISSCEFTLDQDDSLICLIGKGDSTKTTILTAIQWAIDSSRSLSIEDQDFYQCDTSTPITIEVGVRFLPVELIEVAKFGMFLTDGPAFAGSYDPVDGKQPCLTVRLSISDDLDPIWEVYKGKRSKRVGAGDRALLGMSRPFSTTGPMFTWSRGSDLRRLAVSGKEIDAAVIDAVRCLNDSEGQLAFDDSLVSLCDGLRELGVLLEDGKLSSHMLVHRTRLGVPVALFDGNVPIELKGSGTRKLIGAAIGMAVTELGAILVIDEVETGLEPHRLRGLLRTLRDNADREKGQVILTTHSPVAITELNEFEVAAVHSFGGTTTVEKMATRPEGDELVRKKLKSCAEAFLARSVIVCEGKTELGIVRALDEAWPMFLSQKGTAPVDANGGSEMFKLARLLNGCGYHTCIFMDSDEGKYDSEKSAVREEGIQVFDWECGMSTELQLFNDLPDKTVRELISLAVEEWGDERVKGGLSRNGVSFEDVMSTSRCLTPEERRGIGMAAQGSNGKPWFKRIDLGERLGKVAAGVMDDIAETRTGRTFYDLVQWVEVP